ncbi:MAG: histidinol-phosphatase [Bacteroidota bacterium]
MLWTNYHSHCHFCDGKFEPEEYLKRAIDKNMIAYGFSSHAPLPFDAKWCISEGDVGAYVEEVKRLRSSYADHIQVYMGMEVDFIPGVASPKAAKYVVKDLDYTIGSIHFVDRFDNGEPWEVDATYQTFKRGVDEIFGGNVRKAVTRYFALTREMVETSRPDIVGHLDKIKIHNKDGQHFAEFSKWYQVEVLKTLDCIAGAGCIIEINTRGIYKGLTTKPYPSPWILEEILKRKIPVTLNSDTHHPEDIINSFGKTAYLLRELGFKCLRVLLDNQWQDVEFDMDGLRLPQKAQV